LKEKCSKNSRKKSSLKNKKRRSSDGFFSSKGLSDEEFLDTLTESLSDKLEDVKSIINVSSSTQADSFSLDSNQSNSFSKDENNTSQYTSNTDSTPSSEQETNTSQNNSESLSTTSGGASGYSYAGEPLPHYRFEFTNSEFIAFLASLNAIEYIIVLSLITILIMINLNKQEREIIYNFFITIGQTMGSGVDQTAFQVELNSQKEDAKKDNALQTDFDYIYTEMNALQNEIKALKVQLKASNL